MSAGEAVDGSGRLQIGAGASIALDELEFSALRASGAGGQHVNTTSSAVQLRFDLKASSLPPACKMRLLATKDRRLNRDGVLVIKAQEHRSQRLNREAAIDRLVEWVAQGVSAPRPRQVTRVPRGARLRRLQDKQRRGAVKSLRGRVERSRDP